MAEDLVQRGFIDFNRTLGPRVSTKKAKDLLSGFLQGAEGSEESLRGFVDRFPPSVKGKALELIDKYAGMRGAQPVETERVTDPVEFDKPFKAEVEFDPSRNTWYDNPYTMRYANNPKVQAFLQEKGDLLNRRGAYIASEGLKGNIEPFIKHQNWLAKQNILPSDAKSFSEYYAPFNSRYGKEVDLTGNFGMALHDLQSHAIPEAYMGIVDKSMPTGITGADESRASLLESFVGATPAAGLEEINLNIIDNTIAALKELNRVDPNSSYSRLSPVVQEVESRFGEQPYFHILSSTPTDVSAEADYLTKRYGRKVKEANLRTPYGTKLEIDPYQESFVSDTDKQKSVFDKYFEAAESRMPPRKPADVVSFLENAAKPYLQDQQTYNKLTLLNDLGSAYRPQRTETGEAATQAVRRVFDNTFFFADPVGSAAKGLQELTRGVRRTSSALLPGVADLIPSPEAIQTGYRQGPVEMGRQMAIEFVQGLPAAAASAGVLSTPLAAPLAPGVGAGLVGVAGTRALNEVVRQQTGEGVVPKLRQTIGTAPRTGVADRAAPVATNLQRAIGTPAVQNGKTVYWAGPDYGWQSGSSFNKVRDQVIARETIPATGVNRGSRPAVVPQIRPLNQAQRSEMQRRQNRNELQRRTDLARERFNPMRGEFGITEFFFGR